MVGSVCRSGGRKEERKEGGKGLYKPSSRVIFYEPILRKACSNWMRAGTPASYPR